MQIILSNYKDSLTPYRREKGKYYCPACKGHNREHVNIVRTDKLLKG